MIILGLYVHLNHVQLSLFKDIDFINSISIVLEEKELNVKLPELILEICGDFIPDCIALHRGPSGFTSLRVSLAFAEGLSLGWKAKLFTTTHFDLLQRAFSIKNGLIVVDHKGSILPGVHIIDGKIEAVKPFTMNEAIEQNAFLTSSITGVDLSKFLVEMALISKNKWTESYFIDPDYGILPTYKEKQN